MQILVMDRYYLYRLLGKFLILGPCSKLPVAMLHSSLSSRLSAPPLCLRSGDLAAEAATIAQRYAILVHIWFG